ncbi:MAG: hypothetical protein HQK97_11410, partial [Nitrospirae bacterium]|nr:hypothetical protein [Nitrospirota bacterium]
MDDRVTAVSRLDAIVLERQRACLKWKDSMLRKVTQTMRNCGVPAKFAEAAESSLSAGLRQRTGCVLN